jgi:phosphoribosylamine-glycine ligase
MPNDFWTEQDAGMQDDIEQQLVELIERYRRRCLWFLAEGFIPTTHEQAVQVLEYIERYGDREGFVQARRLKQWLSPSISEKSVS